MKLIENNNEIRLMNDKGTKFIVATRNNGMDNYHVTFNSKGTVKTLAFYADKQAINFFASQMLRK